MRHLRLLLTFMAVCVVSVSFAETFYIEGIRYSITDEVEQTVAVTGWDSKYFNELISPTNPNVGKVDPDEIGPEDLVIPWRVLYNGLYYKVTAIGEEAFTDCATLTSVLIPNSIESIGEYAFQNCASLKVVKVQWVAPLAIEPSVFDGVDLTGIADDEDTGVSLYVLSGYADTYRNADVWKDFKFINTYSDLDINMIFEDPYVKKICVDHWDADGDGELTYREARAVTDLGAAFVGDKDITSFNEFRSFGMVSAVGTSCFKGCSNLTSIVFPPSVYTIGQEAFVGCNELTNVTLQNRVTTIGNSAFAGCSKLLAFTFPNTLTTIGAHAFDGCTSITYFNIPYSVTTIGEGAFANCTSNTKLDVASPNKVFVHNDRRTFILDKATRTQLVAYACAAPATTFTIPETVAEILPYAFAGAQNITSVHLSNVTSVGRQAFANNPNLYTVTIPITVSQIDADAFKGVAKGVRVQVEWSSPLDIADGTFANALPLENGDISGRLFVPVGTRSLYAAAKGWKWFNFIVEGTISDYAQRIISFANQATAEVCLNAFDADHDGYLTYEEAEAVTSIGTVFKGAEIGSFEELKYFTALTAIDDEAFTGSTVSKVTLPDGITSIGKDAFAFCNSLTAINVPAAVTNIGSGAFKSCAELTAITVAEENEVYSSGTSGVLFSKDHTTLYQFPGHKMAYSVTIPEGVTTIAPEAFLGATILQGVTIANSVNSIGERAFAQCAVLKNIKVSWPEPLQVPANTFEGIDIENAVLQVPNGTEEIYKEAEVWKEFLNIESYKNFIIFEDENVEKVCVAQWDTNQDGKLSYEEAAAVTTIGKAFSGNKNISRFAELAEFSAITEIPDGAFKNCEALTYVSIPFGVKSIGVSSFEGCSVLSLPILSSNLTTIGKKAFYGCEAFTTFNVNKYIKSIGDGAFGRCTALTRFVVGTDNPTYVGLDGIVFSKDTTTVVAYPAGKVNDTFRVTKDYVKEIRPYAFSGAYKLKNFELNCIKTIGGYAFEYCEGLQQVTFNSHLSTIGQRAFFHCHNLQAITIPPTVKTIGQRAFEGMPIGVRCQVSDATPKEIPENAFSNNGTPTADQISGILFVPEGSAELYKAAQGWDFFDLVIEGNMADYDATLITFADPLVRQLAISAWDTSGDNQISYEEAAAVKSLGEVFTNQPITSFNELQYFTALTKIDDNAFRGTKLATITMPEGITAIGKAAFMGTSVSRWNTLPGLTEIGDSAFAYNDGFVSLTLSANIVKLGTGAFKGCPKLTAINVQTANENYSSASGILYDKAGTTLLQFPAAKAISGDLVIRETVTAIEEDAFNGAQNLTSVTIPVGVTRIGENAFRNCAKLDSVTVAWREPLAVPANTFSGVDVANAALCTPKGFSGVYAEADVWKDFGRFEVYLDDAATIDFEDDAVKALCVANWDLDNDGELTVAEAKQVTSLGTVFTLSPEANIKRFNELKYFTGLKSISTNAFKNCASLASITLPPTITEIAYGAFTGCESLRNITIPASVTTIGSGPFTNCSSLQKFVVESGNTRFVAVDGVLFNAAKNTLVAYPGAKGGEYDVPETVTAMQQYAFCGALNVTRVRLPQGLKAIPNGAFEKCASLKVVNIPESVTNIGTFAFTQCSSLEAIKVEWNTPISVLADVFRTTYIEDAVLYVPAGSAQAYDDANVWTRFHEFREYPDIDVNRDGRGDMLDAVDVVKYVIDSTVDSFDEFLADFDNDQYVTVADAMLLTKQLADGATPNAAAAAAPTTFDEQQDIEENLSLTKDVNNVISICLDSKVRYTAFQFDLTLDNEEQVEIAQLTARKSGHQLLYNKIDDNTYRFVALSLARNSFNGEEGSLINILCGHPQADDIEVSNIKFVTENGRIRQFDNIKAAQPTGIVQVIEAGDKNSSNTYNLNGMRVEKTGKGVYIVNGKKVIFK